MFDAILCVMGVIALFVFSLLLVRSVNLWQEEVKEYKELKEEIEEMEREFGIK